MAGHQLPFLSLLVPLYMIRCMVTWKQTWEVWPALAVAGGSFAIFQYFFATSHLWIPGLVLYPMTDIGGGIFSLLVTGAFLRYWQPANPMHYDVPTTATPVTGQTPPSAGGTGHEAAGTGHEADAEFAQSLLGSGPPTDEAPLTPGRILLAWTPFALMSIFLLLTGFVRQMEPSNFSKPPVLIPGTTIQTNYLLSVPWLHDQTTRDSYLNPKGEQERALFNFAWLTAPGSAVFAAALLSMLLLRMNFTQIGKVLGRTAFQMRIPIPTIAFMLGLSYVTRYAGMDATLGLAFAGTGVLYPFFAPMLGWLGVFLTGTDAGSNALFGSLQQITARQLFASGTFPALDGFQAEVLICTSNSTGGVMGKMIDAQSIVVATAATNQLGKEADIFKAVIWHSVILGAVVGVITMLQAYVQPFTWLVPLK
jgi:lactate permease